MLVQQRCDVHASHALSRLSTPPAGHPVDAHATTARTAERMTSDRLVPSMLAHWSTPATRLSPRRHDECGGLQAGQVDLAHLQDLLARGGVGHELGDVVGDDLPGHAPAVDAPAAALGLGHGRQPSPVMVDLLLVPAGDDHGDPGSEGEVVGGARVPGRHPGAAQREVGEHDGARLHRPTLLIAAQGPAAGVVEQGDPAVSGLLGVGVVGSSKHEGGKDEGTRLAGRVGEHELPGHAEAVADPGVARREGVLAQLHEHTAAGEPLVELIEVGPGLVLAAEQERVEVQDAADRRVRGVLVSAVDE